MLLGIDANTYRPLLDAVHEMATKYEQRVSTFKGYVDRPGGTAWEGQTAEAGQHNVGDGWKVAARIQDLDTKFQTTAGLAVDHTIVPELTNCQHMIENIEAQRNKGLTLTEDLQVGYNPPPGISEKLAAENAKVAQARGEELRESARKWHEAEQEVKRLAEGVMRDIENEVNGAAGIFDIGKAVKDNLPAVPGSTVKPRGIVDEMQHRATADPDGATHAATATGTDTRAEYKEWYPKNAVPVGDKNVDPSKLGGVGAIPGVRDGSDKIPQKLSPTLQPKDVPAFKEVTRQNLINQRVPADQIEQQVNDAVKAAQAPRFLPDAQEPLPANREHPLVNSPGDRFNDIMGRANNSATKTIDDQIEQAKILTGQAGPGAPGVAEAWKEYGLAAAKQAHELTTDPLAAPKMGIEQAKDFYNHPGEFIGKNIIHGTEALAGGVVGGEAAAGARGLLGDLTHAPHPELPSGTGHAGGDTTGHHGPTVEHHAPTDLNHVNTESGGTGAWNQELNKPAPDTHYNVDNRFGYATDDQSRVGHAEMTYERGDEASDRNAYQQRIAGGADRLPGDQGGHIFGSQFGGPGEAINITAMRDTLNSVGARDYYNLETQWREFAEQGKQVRVTVDLDYPGTSLRPDAYTVKTFVDGQLNSTYHFDN